MRSGMACVAAALLLAGCSASDPGAAEGKATSGKARVVVAVIDTAINPYHSFFHESRDRLLNSPIYPQGAPPSAVTPELLAELGIGPEQQITLTRTGRFAQDYAADQAVWDKIRPRRLYWFKGTNILAISFAGGDFAREPLRPLMAKNPHGVGTSGSVLNANPEAIILFVETAGALGNGNAHAFAFLHPAVDIISTSYGQGIPFAPIGTGAFLPEVTAFENSFDGVVHMGKLHFSSGGNQPGLTPHRAGAGPWWSIGVSGSQENEAGSHGREPASGYFPDFIADFTQDIPYCLECEVGISRNISGTSFSTPRAAGVASRVILEGRRALGHSGGIRFVNGKPLLAHGAAGGFSNWELRRALEEAAYVPGFDEADGISDLAIPEEAPWLFTGWGDLTADPGKGVVPAALAQLGLKQSPRNLKDPGFCDFQTQIIKERKLWFDHVALDSGSRNLPDEDPFIFCGSNLTP